MDKPGALALVGSGEYLPEMAELEGNLLRSGMERGKLNRFVQLPLAAGRESQDRLRFWQELGATQAERLDSEQVFLPIYTREDAMREDLAAEIDNAGLIYISGGDPSYLATSLSGTPVWEAIERNWRAGSALAGCSAGAWRYLLIFQTFASRALRAHQVSTSFQRFAQFRTTTNSLDGFQIAQQS